ncbi:hypothetical protein PENDEC_c027G03297 [Penicillium decumbens]|uniref:Increased loss of mitochondrial DNA protein 1 n=1 Tax=Penicillium decumbens TaxID=69771 RepID=A0A1V6NZR6_PENDC|nr:hypothetical protein PENDEC_c027G03297 [Penicillium decumbens]
MVMISSKTLIQVHSVLLILLAGYLIRSPERITNSNMVFMMGEALDINFSTESNPVQSPFVYCAVLLFVEAVVDIVLLSTLPFHEALEEATPLIRPLRNSTLASEDLQVLAKLPQYITKSLTIYWNVWASISGVRFAAYAALSLYIYQGQGAYYTAAAAATGLNQLKHRVVFMYAFLEMMAWFWTFATIRQERQEKLTVLLEDVDVS